MIVAARPSDDEIQQRRIEKMRARSLSRKGVRYEGKRVSIGKRREVLERDKYLCTIPDCGLPHRVLLMTKGIHSPASATVDHIIAKSEGGLNTRENLRAAHNLCNEMRHR